MGKQDRIIAQKAKVKQQQSVKKPKAVKTNLKRLNERVRDKVEKVDQLFQKNEKEGKIETTQQDTQPKSDKK